MEGMVINEDNDFDLIIAGSGVIGLAIAYHFSLNGFRTLIVEKNYSFGMETSSRNSEVIHAGIYYEPNSLKARLCIEGKHMLYEFCKKHSIGFKEIGKYIIALSKSEDKKLVSIKKNAFASGLSDLVYLNNDEIKSHNLPNAYSALFSPSTGIIHSHEFMSKLLQLSESNGVTTAFNTIVERVSHDKNCIKVIFNDNYELKCKYFINACGLNAIDVAKKIDGINFDLLPTNTYAKGSYFKIFKKLPYNNLIYPIPEEGGLGIHLTFDLDGNARFGPDVEYIDNLNYEIDLNKKEIFYKTIKKYVDGISSDDLYPDYAGIRPKIYLNGKVYNDFFISNELIKDNKNIINLMGIESPGLTASLAIAKYTFNKLSKL